MVGETRQRHEPSLHRIHGVVVDRYDVGLDVVSDHVLGGPLRRRGSREHHRDTIQTSAREGERGGREGDRCMARGESEISLEHISRWRMGGTVHVVLGLVASEGKVREGMRVANDQQRPGDAQQRGRQDRALHHRPSLMHSVIEWIDSRRRHPLLEPSGRADVRARASRR